MRHWGRRELTIQPFPFPLHPSMKIPSRSQSCTFNPKENHEPLHCLVFNSKEYLSLFHLPKRVKIIHFFKRGLHSSKFGHMFLGRPSGISLKNRSKYLEKVLFPFTLGRHGIVEGRIYTVEGSPLHRVGQDFHS